VDRSQWIHLHRTEPNNLGGDLRDSRDLQRDGYRGECSSPPATTTVVVNPAPLGLVAANNAPFCVGRTLALSASRIQNAAYLWTGPNGFVSSDQNPQFPPPRLPMPGRIR